VVEGVLGLDGASGGGATAPRPSWGCG